MRILAIGDIHGCLNSLRRLEEFVPIAADDLVVTLGDYVNRGPNSKAVIDWLIARERTGHLIALRGNHEIMLLQARMDDYRLKVLHDVGGAATLASYAAPGDAGRLADIPREHWDFVERARPYYETPTHIFVHAGVYPDLPLEDQPEHMLYWESIDAQWPPAPHSSGKTVICGHTSQRSGLPLNLGHVVCIDTAACKGGWLTCLDIASGRYYQASEQGETGVGWVDELEGR